MNKSVHRLLLGALLAVGLVAPAAQAQAAECTWQRTDLPVPEFYHFTRVWGMGGDYVVATTGSNQGPRTILWHKGQGTLLASPTTDPSSFVRVADVNTTGSVTGTFPTRRNGIVTTDAYVTKVDGTTQLLARPDEWNAEAVAINDHGDVVGRLSQGDVSTTVVWSGGDYTKYRKVKGVFPIGIDNLGTVVTFDGQVITRLGISWRVRKPVADAGLRMGTYDNGVIAGWYSVPNEGTKGAVWNLDGSIKSRIDGVPYAANRRGTTVGSFDGTDFRVWRNGEVATAPDPAPAGVYQSLFLDSNDVVTGTYQGDDFDPHAAQWRCS